MVLLMLNCCARGCYFLYIYDIGAFQALVRAGSGYLCISNPSSLALCMPVVVFSDANICLRLSVLRPSPLDSLLWNCSCQWLAVQGAVFSKHQIQMIDIESLDIFLFTALLLWILSYGFVHASDWMCKGLFL